MANIVLSSLIDDIVGTVGSVLFKRKLNGHFVMVKPKLASKDNLRQNPALAKLSFVINQWNKIDTVSKSIYVVESQNYSFKDKFDNNVFLSPRSFFIKINAMHYCISGDFVNVNKITSVISETVVTKITYNNKNDIVLEMNNKLIDTFIILQFQLLKNNSISAYQTRRKIDQIILDDTTKLHQIGPFMNNKFPFLKKGQAILIYISFQNMSGFRSDAITEKLIIP